MKVALIFSAIGAAVALVGPLIWRWWRAARDWNDDPAWRD